MSLFNSLIDQFYSFIKSCCMWNVLRIRFIIVMLLLFWLMNLIEVNIQLMNLLIIISVNWRKKEDRNRNIGVDYIIRLWAHGFGNCNEMWVAKSVDHSVSKKKKNVHKILNQILGNVFRKQPTKPYEIQRSFVDIQLRTSEFSERHLNFFENSMKIV